MQVELVGCYGNTIKVAAGHYVDLLNPDPNTIEIKSIASALSKICRFGGHCPQFYSVAEHCFHASMLATFDGVPKEAIAAIVLHDATEAYLGDIVKPLKNLLPDYQEAEKRMERAIEVAFGISFTEHRDVIKKYDFCMLKAEKYVMWPTDSHNWTGLGAIDSRNVPFCFWKPKKAEKRFLAVARQYFFVEEK